MDDTTDAERPRTGGPGIPLCVAIFLMPYAFAWFTLRRGYSSLARFIAFGWLVFVIVIGATTKEPKGADPLARGGDVADGTSARKDPHDRVRISGVVEPPQNYSKRGPYMALSPSHVPFELDESIARAKGQWLRDGDEVELECDAAREHETLLTQCKILTAVMYQPQPGSLL